MDRPTPFQVAIMAIRPKTLGAAIAPVMIGTALAASAGKAHWLYASLALLGAGLIQIGTNLANDYFDFIQGADTEERKGPTRVTQAGLMTPTQVKWAFIATFGLSVLSSLPLIIRGGWPILVVGVVSIAAGILYTSGPFALAYLGLGDLFVLIFFGPVAVGGTYYVQALDINMTVLLIGIAPGLIATGILAVNNLRDIDEDRPANKRTLAVRFGETFARMEYLACLGIPALLPILLWLQTGTHPYAMAAALFLLPAIPSIRAVMMPRDGARLNQTLARTGQLLLLYSLLFSVGWVLS